MIEVTDHLTRIRARIARTARSTGRDPDSVRLLAVSKGQPPERIAAACELGLRDFGESYVQEALAKRQQLEDETLCWYFIGRMQSNKTRAVAENFDWVLSVDRLRIAERLSAQRPEPMKALNVCLQVKAQSDPDKGGVPVQEALDSARSIAKLPRLALRGLMIMPPARAGEDQTRRCFGLGAETFQRLRERFATVDTLSMGMSGDLEIAVASGSTLVRIGTDLFGPRMQ